MGGGLNTSEMFEKLESMREVVTEVNAQFKNPVSLFSSVVVLERLAHLKAYCPQDLTTFIPVMSASILRASSHETLMYSSSTSSLRVPVAVRDGAPHPGAHAIPD